MDRVEGSEQRRPESSGRKQQVSVNDQLVDRIEVGERNVEITADAVDRPQYFAKRQLARHQDIVVTQRAVSGSATANFTIADESRYHTLTARLPEARQALLKLDARNQRGKGRARGHLLPRRGDVRAFRTPLRGQYESCMILV